jgi:hypothetical protein
LRFFRGFHDNATFSGNEVQKKSAFQMRIGEARKWLLALRAVARLAVRKTDRSLLALSSCLAKHTPLALRDSSSSA